MGLNKEKVNQGPEHTTSGLMYRCLREINLSPGDSVPRAGSSFGLKEDDSKEGAISRSFTLLTVWADRILGGGGGWEK